MSVAPKSEKLVACEEGLLFTKLDNSFITWLHEVTWQQKALYFRFGETYGTKLDRVMASEKGSSPRMITWHNSHITNKKSYICNS